MATNALRNEDYDSAEDQYRGIRKPRTVKTDYVRTGSIPARISAANDNAPHPANDNDPNEMRNAESEREDERRRKANLERRAKQHMLGQTKKLEVRIATPKVRKLAAGRSWVGIGIVFSLWIFQFWLAILSFIGFYGHVYLVDLQTNTTIGSIVGWFWDFSQTLPLKELGYATWLISVLISILIVFGYLAWYRILGIEPFRTPLVAVFSGSCIAISMLPIVNILPFLVAWVFVINTTSLFSKT